MLAVCDNTKKFMYMYADRAGSVHDARMCSSFWTAWNWGIVQVARRIKILSVWRFHIHFVAQPAGAATTVTCHLRKWDLMQYSECDRESIWDTKEDVPKAARHRRHDCSSLQTKQAAATTGAKTKCKLTHTLLLNKKKLNEKWTESARQSPPLRRSSHVQT